MRVGIDYGGTKIAGIALNKEGVALASGRVPTPRHDYAGGLKAIGKLTAELETKAGQRATSVGIGVPGSVDRTTGQVSLGNSNWLQGQDLRGDLSAALDRPVRVANDANCFALSEAVDGAGAGLDVVFGAILGTGVGGGLVVHGRLVHGAHAIGGEWGHMPLPEPGDDERPGPLCSCGVAGHTEAWLSGPGLAADHARETGQDIPAPEIAERAMNGDAMADATLRRFESRLGRSLAVVVNIVDPDIIVLGGGLSNVQRLYDTVPGEIERHVFGGRFRTKLLPNMHGDASGVRGAAWL